MISELGKYNIIDYCIFKPTYKNEITDYLLKNSIRFELLVLFGGDGTFNEVLNGLMPNYYKPKLLYIPTGTANDLGKYLYISNNFHNTFKLLNTKPVLMDVCKVNNRYFTYALACGKFTNVSYGSNMNKYKKIFGRIYYYFRGLKELFSKTEIHVTFNNEKEKKILLILLLNIWRVGNFKINRKNNKLNDGYINVVFFKNTIFFGTFSIFLFLIFGIKLKGITEIRKVNSFTITTKSPVLFNSDGEECDNTNLVKVDVIKEVLEIYIPKKGKDKYFDSH